MPQAAGPVERTVDPFDAVVPTADLPDPFSFFDDDPLDVVFDPLEVVAEQPVAVERPRETYAVQGVAPEPEVLAGRAYEAPPSFATDREAAPAPKRHPAPEPRQGASERRRGLLRAAGVLSVAGLVAWAFALNGAHQSAVRPLDSIGATALSSAGLEAATHRVELHAAQLERGRQRARARQLRARRERTARAHARQRSDAPPVQRIVAAPAVAARPAPIAAPAAVRVPSAAKQPRRSVAAAEFAP